MISKHQKDARVGNAESAYQLAKIYDEGRFVKQDEYQAYYWYMMSAKLNNNDSMLMVGYMLCRGVGVQVDSSEANKWLKLSGKDVFCN